MQRIKIENDTGIGYQTKVTDAETGEMIERVAKVSMVMDTHSALVAELTVYAPIVSVLAYAQIRSICPCCGAAIEEDDERNQ
jgi:hypothetical protein